MSKTPNFDKKLDEILSSAKPGKKSCEPSGRDFCIDEKDIEFFEKLRVPPFKFSFNERMRRLLSFKNARNLYRRKDIDGNKLLSIYPADAGFGLLPPDKWWGDNWEQGESFGFDYNEDEPFFVQLQWLSKKVPRMALSSHPDNENSEYTNDTIKVKDCYFVFDSANSENVLYGEYLDQCKDSMECHDANKLELCYWFLNGANIFNVKFSYDTANCRDSWFLYKCDNCKNCYMCVGLSNKEYNFKNKQLTKEEYQKKLEEVDLGDRDTFEKEKNTFYRMADEAVQHGEEVYFSENSTGNYITRCKKCFNTYNVVNCQDLRHTIGTAFSKDSMDIAFGCYESELCYECVRGSSNYNSKFVVGCQNSRDIEYCDNCFNCKNCFGCIGLKGKEYHVLNKEYSEEDYWKLIDKIKTSMLERGEYGQFFPVEMSPFPYNASDANIYFPMKKEEAGNKGYKWKELGIADTSCVQPDIVPKNIKDVTDDILKKPICCTKSKRPFKITKAELELYRKLGIPIPILHPDERYKERLQRKRPYEIFKRKCDSCGKEFYSTFKQDFPVDVLCNKCYVEKKR